MAVCSSLVPRCDQPTTVPRPPKVSHTVSHRQSSRPVVPPSRATWQRLTVRIGWIAALKKCSGYRLRTKTKWRRSSASPAPAKPAPTAPLRSGGCHGLCFHPRPGRSVRRRSRPAKKESLARRRRQCLRASGGAHCRVARERCLRERKQPTQARVVSVCRLRRNQAGRAERFGESWPRPPTCYGRLPLLRDGGARLWWQSARQPSGRRRQ